MVRRYRRAIHHALTAAAFLKALVRAVPYRVHTVLIGTGVQFADSGKPGRYSGQQHLFDRIRSVHGIEHGLTAVDRSSDAVLMWRSTYCKTPS